MSNTKQTNIEFIIEEDKPTTYLITTDQYALQFEPHMEIYFTDMSSLVDLNALQKKLKLKTTIKFVIAETRRNPEFKNVANKDITYKYSAGALSTDDGACKENMGGTLVPVVNHPLSDIFIVY